MTTRTRTIAAERERAPTPPTNDHESRQPLRDAAWLRLDAPSDDDRGTDGPTVGSIDDATMVVDRPIESASEGPTVRVPMRRNIVALVTSTFTTSGLGALYWAIAARRYSSHDVGINASLISTMALLANLASLNFSDALNRFIPVSGHRARRIVVGSYTIAVSLGMLATAVFVIGAPHWTPSLVPVLHNSWFIAVYIAAVAVWCVFVLQDAVMIALRRSTYVLAENSLYGVAKIVLLLGLASALPRTGIFYSWTAPLVVAVVAVNVVIFRRLVPQHISESHGVTEAIEPRAVRRFLVADYVGDLAWTTSISLMPLVVLYVDGSRRGPASSAYVYLAWSMAYTLFLVSRNTGMVLTSEGARDPDRLREHAHRAIMLGLRIVVPLAVALAAGAPLLLRVYGTEYAQHATRLLQILAVTMIPAAIPVYYVTIARVRQHLSAMVATTLLTTLPALLLGIPLLLKMGIVGIGWSWCIVETTAAIVLLVGPMRQYLFAPSGPVEAVPEAAPRAEVVVETPATIRSSIPIVSALALAAAIGLWIVALTHLDVAKIGKYGLVSALPGAYFGSLVALAAGFVWAVRRNAAPVVYGALTATLVAVLHATPAIEYHALRYAWAWRHVGVVDLMLRHHALVPNTPVLPIYQQWPGFFGAATTFTAAARFPSALSYAAWAPPVFAALDALALVAVFRSFTTDRRRIAIAVWFFVVANWIGQEYFAPQAFDFLLFLCLLAIVLRNYGSASRTFRWEPRALRRLASDHPHERLWVTGPQRRGAAIACLVLMAAIVVSHPLTPLLACMALTALVVTGLIDRVWPAVAMVAITVTWYLTGAWSYTSSNIKSLLGGIGSIDGNVGANVRDLGTLSAGQQVVATLGRFVVAAIVGLACIGLARRWRRRMLDRTAVLLCAVPVGLLVSSNYGGEAVFRAYLFALPFFAIIAATAFLPGDLSRMSRVATAALLAACLALVGGFLFAYYGKERWAWFAPGEVRAATLVATIAPDHSLLVQGTMTAPTQGLHAERFTYVSIVDEPPTSRHGVLADPVGTLSSWLSQSKYRAGYLLITRSQIAESEETGLLPRGTFATLERALLRSGRFTVLYHDRDALLVTTERGHR